MGKWRSGVFLLDDLLGDIIYKYLLCIYIQKRELGGEEIAIKYWTLGTFMWIFSRFEDTWFGWMTKQNPLTLYRRQNKFVFCFIKRWIEKWSIKSWLKKGTIFFAALYPSSWGCSLHSALSRYRYSIYIFLLIIFFSVFRCFDEHRFWAEIVRKLISCKVRHTNLEIIGNGRSHHKHLKSLKI